MPRPGRYSEEVGIGLGLHPPVPQRITGYHRILCRVFILVTTSSFKPTVYFQYISMHMTSVWIKELYKSLHFSLWRYQISWKTSCDAVHCSRYVGHVAFVAGDLKELAVGRFPMSSWEKHGKLSGVWRSYHNSYIVIVCRWFGALIGAEALQAVHRAAA